MEIKGSFSLGLRLVFAMLLFCAPVTIKASSDSELKMARKAGNEVKNGDTNVDRENWKKAIKNYRKALKYTPDDAYIHRKIAYCYEKLENSAEALSYNERAKALGWEKPQEAARGQRTEKQVMTAAVEATSDPKNPRTRTKLVTNGARKAGSWMMTVGVIVGGAGAVLGFLSANEEAAKIKKFNEQTEAWRNLDISDPQFTQKYLDFQSSTKSLSEEIPVATTSKLVGYTVGAIGGVVAVVGIVLRAKNPPRKVKVEDIGLMHFEDGKIVLNVPQPQIGLNSETRLKFLTANF